MSRFTDGWRAAGLFLPISSLPTDYGIGDLGPSAHQFAEFAKRAGVSFWQVLPLGPSSPALGNSPYSSFSAFAGSELLISPEALIEDRVLTEAEAAPFRAPHSSFTDYEHASEHKKALVDLAFAKVKGALLENRGFASFLDQNASWVNDYALFMAAHGFFGGRQWSEWPEDLKFRWPNALTYYGEKLAEPILRVKYGQHLFFRQLEALKGRLRSLGLGLVGDLAFYVNHDSSDVWANRRLFCLDNEGETEVQAGVQPDYYSKTGQLWGNPVYNWPEHEPDGYAWWRSRVLHNLAHYDWVRLDHFRAFCAFWSVAKGEKDAVRGSWRWGPGMRLFQTIPRSGDLNIICEDLGIITPDVTELRKALECPGMRVLQFGAADPTGLSIHAPFRIEPDNLVYTSTHDTNTARGWWAEELKGPERKELSVLAGAEVTEETAARSLIRLAWLSAGALAVTTVQDLLSLGSEARLNVPGTPEGNWTWRLPSLDSLTESMAGSLAALTQAAGRDNMRHPNLLHY
jgi:4-alpha-glucanotransferase